MKGETTWTAAAAAAKIVLTVAVAVLLAVGGRKAYQFGYGVFAKQAFSDPPGKEAAVTVREGETVSEIAQILEEKGIIEDAIVFCVQERLSEYRGVIQPGTYVVNSAQTPDEIIQTLTRTPSETKE